MIMFNFLKWNNRKTYYNNGSSIGFTNEEEFTLFEKYLELMYQNGVKYVKREREYTSSNYFRYYDISLEINLTNCSWKCGIKETKSDESQEIEFCTFDVLENAQASAYIFRVAKILYDKEQEILKAEREEQEKIAAIEREMKASADRIEKYVARTNELSWWTKEFAWQFKILRQIAMLWEKNVKLLAVWKENVEKIHELRKNFYNWI